MSSVPTRRTYGSKKTYGSASNKRSRLSLLADLPASEAALDLEVQSTSDTMTTSDAVSSSGRASTPPTTPGLDADDEKPVIATSPYPLRQSVRPLKRDLDAYFAPSSSKVAATKAKKPSSLEGKKPKLEQLQFDLSSRSRTASCPECGMAFTRGTEEDTTVHDRHHRRVVGGIDYTGWKGDTIVREDIDCGPGDESGRIIMVAGSMTGAQGRKVTEILETIDTELSSTSLPPEELAKCKLFLLVSRERKKVLACALAAPISSAFAVISPPAATDAQERTLRFGDDSATFCAPTSRPARVGIHRIWTSRSVRRLGLASLCLNAVCDRFTYACHLPKDSIAFSQPTGDGAALAKRWTGKTTGWLVFEG